ncbi:MAG: 30S ribosomal protein S7 [Candidatus Woesearchaeota archaeon]|nr:30S ribosomal protein S7 [Candidatus Woesearchaeota archaeon]
MVEILAFNKWPTTGITVEDPGLKEYISLQPRVVPRSAGRYMGFRFYKSKVFIVERFMNKLTVSGHKSKKHFKSSGRLTGKYATASNLMKHTLEKVEQRTGKNPIEVLVKAIENAAPREETITIEYGGARYPKAVECSPQRRVDFALRIFAQGSFHRSFNTKKSMVDSLTDEIVNAYNMSGQSIAITKKLELERQADSSR